jgi:DNA polymerase
MNKIKVYKDIKQKVADCNRCGLKEERFEGLDPCVMGQGNLDAKVVFFAQNPGAEEVKNSRPLASSGKSGKLYEKVLKYFNLAREDVYTSNTILCKTPNNRDPEPYECKLCRPYLKAQIELIDPRLIITFGRFAAGVFLTNFKITRDHGQIYKSENWNRDIFPLYHPAYVSCYCPVKQKEEFKKDLKKLKYIIRNNL